MGDTFINGEASFAIKVKINLHDFGLSFIEERLKLFKKLRWAGIKLKQRETNPCCEISLTPTSFQDATIRVASKNIPDFVMITPFEADVENVIKPK